MALSRIDYSRFRVHKIDPRDMTEAKAIPLPFNPGVDIKLYGTEIDEPAAQVIIEDFLPGSEINWVFPHDELQYCLSGKAEIEFWMPPLYQEKETAVLEAGSVYLLPQGGRMRIRVIGDEPFRHICICVPNPGYPVETAAAIRAARQG